MFPPRIKPAKIFCLSYQLSDLVVMGCVISASRIKPFSKSSTKNAVIKLASSPGVRGPSSSIMSVPLRPGSSSIMLGSTFPMRRASSNALSDSIRRQNSTAISESSVTRRASITAIYSFNPYSQSSSYFSRRSSGSNEVDTDNGSSWLGIPLSEPPQPMEEFNTISEEPQPTHEIFDANAPVFLSPLEIDGQLLFNFGDGPPETDNRESQISPERVDGPSATTDTQPRSLIPAHLWYDLGPSDMVIYDSRESVRPVSNAQTFATALGMNEQPIPLKASSDSIFSLLGILRSAPPEAVEESSTMLETRPRSLIPAHLRYGIGPGQGIIYDSTDSVQPASNTQTPSTVLRMEGLPVDDSLLRNRMKDDGLASCISSPTRSATQQILKAVFLPHVLPKRNWHSWDIPRLDRIWLPERNVTA